MNLALLLVPAVLLVLAVGLAMQWRLETRVQLEVRATGLTLRTAVNEGGSGDRPNEIVQARIRSLSVENFQDFAFDSVDVQSAANISPDGQSSGGWREFGAPNDSPLILVGGVPGIPPIVDLAASARAAPESAPDVSLNAAPGVRMSIATRAGSFTLQLEERPAEIRVSGTPGEWLSLESYSVGLQSPEMEATDQRLFRVRFRAESPAARIRSAADAAMNLSVEPIAPNAFAFASSGLAISSVEFLEFAARENRFRSTLSGEGRLRYVDYDHLPDQKIESGEFLSLANLRDFQIESAKLADPAECDCFLVRMSGVAGEIQHGARNAARDRRVSLFDIFWENPEWLALLGVLFWALPAGLGAYRLYREFFGAQASDPGDEHRGA